MMHERLGLNTLRDFASLCSHSMENKWSFWHTPYIYFPQSEL